MRFNRKYLIAAAGAAALVAAGAGVAVAGGGPTAQEGSDAPIPADALQRASDAALEVTGGGEVTETEISDQAGDSDPGEEEDGYYEVEVTLDDGSQVDVHLDENFALVRTDTDHGGGTGGPDD